MEQDLPGTVRLNLGCGKSYWEGWVNIDSSGDVRTDVCADVGDLPFSDGHADVLCAIHLVEHLYRWEVESVLSEWNRVLRNHGKLILEFPSMDKLCHYINICMLTGKEMEENFLWKALWGDPRQTTEGMGHKWGYTFLQMKSLLKGAGFRNVICLDPRYHVPSRDMRVEAVK